MRDSGKAPVLLAVALASAYLPPLTRSLWVDEAGTFWMARGGPLAALAKTWHWPGQSLLFAAIESLFCFDGFFARDLLLRVPALIGGALVCWFVYHFAEDLFGPGSGRVAALLAAFNPMLIEFATQARPYSLAMAAVTASFWALYRRRLGWWWVASVLVIYLHYLFAVVFLAQLVYLMLDRRRVRWLHIAIAVIAAV